MTAGDDDKDVARWAWALALVLAGHAAIALGVLVMRSNAAAGTNAPVIAIELAALVQAPQEANADLPPQPEPPQPELPQFDQRDLVLPEPEPVTETAPSPPEVVAVPVEPQKREPPKPKRPKQARPPKPPQQVPGAPARQANARSVAAPAPGAALSGAALASWQSRVAAHLNGHKRYPAEAASRGERGVSVVVFAVDRGGRVLASSLKRSSGSTTLDAEATSLARRASPVPAPPPELAGARITLSVPIRFSTP